MDSSNWKWCIVADVHADTDIGVSVEAGGTRLVDERAHNPLDAVASMSAALADFDEGDSVTVVVHGRNVPMSAWTGTNSHLALYFLATTLAQACFSMVREPEPTQPSAGQGPQGVRARTLRN